MNLAFDDYAKYTANTGIAQVTTANANLDGTGAVVAVITAASNGTFIKTISIKTISNVIDQGMVRLFVYDGSHGVFLLMEIGTPIAGKSGKFASFSRTVTLNYFLKAGYSIYASTQETKTFNVIAEGYDVSYP